MAKRTPLYEEHIGTGGKMVEFAGYEMPIQYETGVIQEHKAVREKAGLFDVSHMGEFLVEGAGALGFLNHVLTNKFDNLKSGSCRYAILCNQDGGCVDDLLVYRFSQDNWMLVVNASNAEKDFMVLEQLLDEYLEDPEVGEIVLTDESDNTALIALQGPRSKRILSKLAANPEELPTKNYTFRSDIEIAGQLILVSRTGYTGEYGYEIYLDPEQAPEMWAAILEAGEEEGLIPAGLGARDTLRLEAGMPLYGHEMDETVTPMEADLGFAVKLTKKDFVGKAGIEQGLPLRRKRVGLLVTGKGIVREQQTVYANGEEIGVTTSGTFAPSLDQAIAMAMIEVEHAEVGTQLEVQVRNRRIPVEVVALPFYQGGSVVELDEVKTE